MAPSASLYPRLIASRLAEVLADTPAVLVAGPRQAGKTADIQFIDTGLLASLAAISPEALVQDRGRFGAVLETFVFGELLKHAAASVSSLWGQ